MVEPFPFPPVVGAQLDPGYVLGRDGWILDALEHLRRGNNLICNDPRRMGKTCVIDRLVNEPGDGFVAAVKIDYEGVSSTNEFLMRTVRTLQDHASLWKRIGGQLARYFDGTEMKGKASGAELTVKVSQQQRSPEDLLEAVLGAVSAQLPEGQALIVAMDEVPLALQNIIDSNENGPRDAGLLLQHLRSARKNATNIRWIVTGSVGFHHVLGRVHNGTTGLINDLQNVHLGPLDDEGAVYLAKCLALGIGRELDPAAHDAVLTTTGGIPYLLQAVFHHLGDHALDQAEPINAADLERTIMDYFEDRDASRANDHFLNRIQIYYLPELRDPAAVMLDFVATQGSVTTQEVKTIAARAGLTSTQFASVKNLLIDDHYVVEDRQIISFRYPVLARLWKIRRSI